MAWWLQEILIVGVGGFLGANARFLLSNWITDRAGTLFPWATLVINVSGSFVIGLTLVLALERLPLDPRWRLLFVTGFLGAYTTFSTFSWETLSLVERHDYVLAGFYVTASVALGFAAVLLGAHLARRT